MAHWISSKLKAAENLLQQIDQQAAESLGKNEKPQPDELVIGRSPAAPETKPLLKDQLKKKPREKEIRQSSNRVDRISSNVVSRSNNDANHGVEAGISKNLTSRPSSTSKLTDSDWTELLSLPDTKGLSGGDGGNKSITGIGGARGLRKDSKKVGNSGSRFSLSSIDGRSKTVRSNGALTDSKKSDVGGSVNDNNAESNDNVIKSDDGTSTTSTIQSPSSGGELDRSWSPSPLPIDKSNITDKVKMEADKHIVSGEGLDTSEKFKNSLKMMSVPHEGKLDSKLLNVGEKIIKDNDDKSRIGSRISTSSDKVSSTRSDGESNSGTETSSSSDSESEREREERRKRRQQILAERAAAKAVEAIKERENLVAKLEGEKQSLEKIHEERAKQQVQEASELQTTMMETMNAVELEKQKHNSTRMDALARLAKLESASAALARSLAHVQKNLEIEVDHVTQLRQQLQMKEAAHEELRRKIANPQQKGDKFQGSKGIEFELEMLKTEYTFLNDKVEKVQDQARTLETSIETTRRELECPTEVEMELKRRLNQFTDHLIQKQAQVETLSSEKAMLLLRIEAVSRSLEENNSTPNSVDPFPSSSTQRDLESGRWQISNSKLRPLLKQKMLSSQQHLGSFVRQLDSLFCAGAVFLRRNSTARIWAIVYFVCLHVWVIYIMSSHSHSPVEGHNQSGAVVSLESINNTGGGIV